MLRFLFQSDFSPFLKCPDRSVHSNNAKCVRSPRVAEEDKLPRPQTQARGDVAGKPLHEPRFASGAWALAEVELKGRAVPVYRGVRDSPFLQ